MQNRCVQAEQQADVQRGRRGAKAACGQGETAGPECVLTRFAHAAALSAVRMPIPPRCQQLRSCYCIRSEASARALQCLPRPEPGCENHDKTRPRWRSVSLRALTNRVTSSLRRVNRIAVISNTTVGVVCSSATHGRNKQMFAEAAPQHQLLKACSAASRAWTRGRRAPMQPRQLRPENTGQLSS